MSKHKSDRNYHDEILDKEGNIKNIAGDNAQAENLLFNEEQDSFEFDVKSDNPDYQHPDPYNTAVKDGGDMNSSYDESNPLAVDEYIKNESLETDVDKLGMHIDNGESVVTDIVDHILAHTPEDDRDDLDEEGYPKKVAPPKTSPVGGA